MRTADITDDRGTKEKRLEVSTEGKNVSAYAAGLCFARSFLSLNSATERASDPHPSSTIWSEEPRKELISIADPVELLFHFFFASFFALNPSNQKPFHQTSFLHAGKVFARYD